MNGAIDQETINYDDEGNSSKQKSILDHSQTDDKKLTNTVIIQNYFIK